MKTVRRPFRWHRLVLLFSIAGISLGSVYFSGGMCGGGGGGGGHYQVGRSLAAR